MSWLRSLLGALLTLIFGLGAAAGVFGPALPLLLRSDRSYASQLGELFWPLGRPPLMLGGGVDLLGTWWTFATVDQMLRGLRGTIEPRLYAPYGFDQGIHQGFAWADAVLSWPLVRILGVPGFYNAHLLSQMTLTYAAGVALFRALSAPWSIAWALAFPLVWNPLCIKEIAEGRPTQAHLVFHALFLMGLARAMRPGGASWAVVGGVALAGACLVYWFSGVAVGIYGLLVYLLAIALRSAPRPRLLAVGPLLALSAVVPALIVGWRLAAVILAGEGRTVMSAFRSKPWMSWDLGPFSLPIQRPPTGYDGWGGILDAIAAKGLPATLLGLGLLGLAGLIGRGAWRRSLPWGLAGAFVLSFPLGSAIQMGPVYLPTAFSLGQALFPALVRCFQVERLLVAGLLGLLAFAAVGLGSLLGRRGWGWLAWILGPLIVGWAAQWRPQSTDLHVGSFVQQPIYEQVAHRWPGGIIDVPLQASDREYVLQLWHGQPLLGGPGLDAVRDQDHVAFCEHNSLLVALERLGTRKGIASPSYTAEDLAQLRTFGFRAVVVHLDESAAGAEAFEALLGHHGISDGRNHLGFPLPALDADAAPTPE